MVERDTLGNKDEEFDSYSHMFRLMFETYDTYPGERIVKAEKVATGRFNKWKLGNLESGNWETGKMKERKLRRRILIKRKPRFARREWGAGIGKR